MGATATVALKWFGPRLKSLRKQAGLSQAALAKAAGISLGAVQRIEYGKRVPGFETVVSLTRALDLPLSAFNPPDDADEDDPPKPKPRKKP